MKGLQAIALLARTGSLTAAAGELGVTRSALSHRIADLEQELGVTLVRKLGRKAVLTDDAEALLSVMGDALDRIGAAVEPLHRRRSQLRVSTVVTFASLWLLPRLPAFQARHPDIELAISTTRRPIGLHQEDFDCAIRHGAGSWDGLRSTLLFRETLVPVAAFDTEHSFDDAPIIMARSRYRDWQLWCKGDGRFGKPPGRTLLLETRAQALEAALAGSGIAVIDMAYVTDHLSQGRLRELGAAVDLAEGYYVVQRPNPRNDRFVDAFREWLLEEVRSIKSKKYDLSSA
ncbi:MAG TPA: LysR substrate-binding domain-containing protein [Sphingobium sp.]